ncbi:hypothetical protein C7E12_19880, partial [Stenotrophomonas maltophilia]
MDDVDLLVIGGGINGAGIARDASGRAPIPSRAAGSARIADALRSMAPTVNGGAARRTDTGRGDTMDDVDLLVIGGGINGAGIARDASGR